MISSYDGNHSIRIGLDPLRVVTERDKRRYRNTWEDWCLIPTSRPYVVQPPPNEAYLDIPGMNGQYDITDKLHNYPTYGMREGSWEFHIAHDKAAERLGVPEDHVWHVLYEEIANYLHGQGLRCILEDDPWWYYDGRFKINAFKSSKVYSTITIDYKLEPYKWATITTGDSQWPWDPFAFTPNNIVPTTVAYNEDTRAYSNFARINVFRNLRFDSDDFVNIRTGGQNDRGVWSGSWNLPQGYVGSAPTTPVITFTPPAGSGITTAKINIDNSCTGVFTPLISKPQDWDTDSSVWGQYYENRGYHYTMLSSLYDEAPQFVQGKYYVRAGTRGTIYTLQSGVNVLPDFEIVCPTQDDWVRIAVSGHGYITLDFRMGRL